MKPETIYVIMRSFYIDSEEHREVITARRDEKEAETLCNQWNQEAKESKEDEDYWYSETELS